MTYRRWILVLLCVVMLAIVGLVWARPDPSEMVTLGALMVIAVSVIFLIHRMIQDRALAGTPSPDEPLSDLLRRKGIRQRKHIIPSCILGAIIALICLAFAPSPTMGINGWNSDETELYVARCLTVVGLLGLYVGGVLILGWCRRRAAEQIIIGQIASVVRQNLPLSTALALAAQSEGGASRRRLYWIASFLDHGVPLSEATRLGYPECPSMVLSLMLAGEQSGQLPAAIQQAESYLRERSRSREGSDGSVWPYGLVVMTMMVLLVSGLMIAVIPKFKEIFKDFNTRLPGITVALIDISEWMVAGTPPGWVLFLPLALAVPVAIYLSLRRRQVPDPGWTSRLADWVRWHMPGWRRMEYGSGMAAMLGVMRIAIRAGMNVPAAARLAGTVDVNAALRPRMHHLADLLNDGVPLSQAVRQARLGEVTAIALATGQRTGDMDGALRYAADYHSAIVSRWWLLLRSLSWPVCTMLMAVCVGFVVVAMFQPLVSLINASMGWGH